MAITNYCPFLNCLLLVYKIFLVIVTHSIERRSLDVNVSGMLKLLGKHFVSLSRSASDEATSTALFDIFFIVYSYYVMFGFENLLFIL